MNVQLISVAKCVLLNIVAQWPGGTHNSFSLRNSAVGSRLEELQETTGSLVLLVL